MASLEELERYRRYRQYLDRLALIVGLIDQTRQALREMDEKLGP